MNYQIQAHEPSSWTEFMNYRIHDVFMNQVHELSSWIIEYMMCSWTKFMNWVHELSNAWINFMNRFHELSSWTIIYMNWVHELSYTWTEFHELSSWTEFHELSSWTEFMNWVHELSSWTEFMNWVHELSSWTEFMNWVHELSNSWSHLLHLHSKLIKATILFKTFSVLQKWSDKWNSIHDWNIRSHTCIVIGPTQYAKTRFVLELIRCLRFIHPPPNRIVWCFGCYQDLFRSVDGVEFVERMPDMNILDGGKKGLFPSSMTSCPKPIREWHKFSRNDLILSTTAWFT